MTGAEKKGAMLFPPSGLVDRKRAKKSPFYSPKSQDWEEVGNLRKDKPAGLPEGHGVTLPVSKAGLNRRPSNLILPFASIARRPERIVGCADLGDSKSQIWR